MRSAYERGTFNKTISNMWTHIMPEKMSPMDLLKELPPEFAKNQMDARSLLRSIGIGD